MDDSQNLADGKEKWTEKHHKRLTTSSVESTDDPRDLGKTPSCLHEQALKELNPKPASANNVAPDITKFVVSNPTTVKGDSSFPAPGSNAPAAANGPKLLITRPVELEKVLSTSGALTVSPPPFQSVLESKNVEATRDQDTQPKSIVFKPIVPGESNSTLPYFVAGDKSAGASPIVQYQRDRYLQTDGAAGSDAAATISWQPPEAPAIDPGLVRAIETSAAAHNFVQQQLDLNKHVSGETGLPGQPLNAEQQALTGMVVAPTDSTTLPYFASGLVPKETSIVLATNNTTLPCFDTGGGNESPIVRYWQDRFAPTGVAPASNAQAITWQPPKAPEMDPGLVRAMENSEAAHNFIQQQLALPENVSGNAGLPSRSPVAEQPPLISPIVAPTSSTTPPYFASGLVPKETSIVIAMNGATLPCFATGGGNESPIVRYWQDRFAPTGVAPASDAQAITWQPPKTPEMDPGLVRAMENSAAAHNFIQQQLALPENVSGNAGLPSRSPVAEQPPLISTIVAPTSSTTPPYFAAGLVPKETSIVIAMNGTTLPCFATGGGNESPTVRYWQDRFAPTGVAPASDAQAITWQPPKTPEMDPGLVRAMENSAAAHNFIQQQLALPENVSGNAGLPSRSPVAEQPPLISTIVAPTSSTTPPYFAAGVVPKETSIVAAMNSTTLPCFAAGGGNESPTVRYWPDRFAPTGVATASDAPAITWQPPKTPEMDPGLVRAMENSAAAHNFIQQQLALPENVSGNAGLPSRSPVAEQPPLISTIVAPTSSTTPPYFAAGVVPKETSIVAAMNSTTLPYFAAGGGNESPTVRYWPDRSAPASIAPASDAKAITWQPPKAPEMDPGLVRAMENSAAAHNFVQQQLSRNDSAGSNTGVLSPSPIAEQRTLTGTPGNPPQDSPLSSTTTRNYQPTLPEAYSAPRENPFSAPAPTGYRQPVEAPPAALPARLNAADSSRAAPQESLTLPSAYKPGSDSQFVAQVKPLADTTAGAATRGPDSSLHAAASLSGRNLEEVSRSATETSKTSANGGVLSVPGRATGGDTSVQFAAASPNPRTDIAYGVKAEATAVSAQKPPSDAERLVAGLPGQFHAPGAAGSKSHDPDEKIVRYLAAPSPPAQEATGQKPLDLVALVNSTNTLARAAQPVPAVAALDQAAGKVAPSVAGKAEATPVPIKSSETISEAVSLSSLIARSQHSGDAILGGQQLLGGRLAANMEAIPGLTRADAASIAAMSARATGTATAEAAVASALIGGRGIFLVDPTAIKAVPSEVGAVGKIGAVNPNLSPLSGSTQGGPPAGVAALLPGTSKAAGWVSADIGGRIMRIDPASGQICFVTRDGKTDSRCNLADLENIRRGLAERRYLTGVEIAIACAIASAAVAKSRHDFRRAEEPDGETVEPDVEAAGPTQNKSPGTGSTPQNIFKRPSYMVAVNDSLVQIAEKLFDDASVAWLIADINAGGITEHFEDGKRIVELRTRQLIDLPLASEVKEFKLTRARDIKAGDIVTIVSMTELDRQLLDSFRDSRPDGSASPAVSPAAGNLPQLVVSEAPAPQPLMRLVDFGASFGRAVLPSINAIASNGLNLKTYICKVDSVAPRPVGEPVETKRSTVEMVAHDLKSPLMSAQVSIDLVQELHVDLSDEAFEAIQSCQINLTVTIESALRLLNCARELNKLEKLAFDESESESRRSRSGNNVTGSTGADSAQQMTELLSGLAEEMRIPLRLSLESLLHFEQLESERMSTEAREHLLRSENGINRGLGLINNQLRVEHFFKDAVCADLEKSECDVSVIASDAAASLRSLAEQKHVQLLNQSKSMPVLADREKLTRVVINFLSNAIKFSPENTSITITSRVLRNTVRIAVADQGAGLTRQEVKKLFERFSQVCSQSSQGHGLGLSICRLIVHSHGGEIGVTSTPGKGSTFWLEIPRGAVAGPASPKKVAARVKAIS